MTANEEFYLGRYRELAAKKNGILAMIAQLRTICESLNDWQKTAADLHSFSGTSQAWNDERLAALGTLRANLLDYHHRTEELDRAWSQLKEEERTGLMQPGTLRPPAQ